VKHVPQETWEETASRLVSYGLSAESVESYGRTLRKYYLNPTIEWIEAGHEASGGPIAEPGYYILDYCEVPECCRPKGPFKSEVEAREWSRQNLVGDLPGD